MHRKDLMKRGFKGGIHSTSKNHLKRHGEMLKEDGRIKNYRVVGYDDGYELYVR